MQKMMERIGALVDILTRAPFVRIPDSTTSRVKSMFLNEEVTQMTGQEKWKVIDEVCDEIRASLQRDADYLRKQAEDYGDKNLEKKLSLEEEATTYVKAQFNVTSVEIRLKMSLIENN